MSKPNLDQDHALDMTVYTMPTADQINVGNQTKMGRWKMFLVFLVCAAPVVASYFSYYVIRPEGRRNFGELIEPMRTLPELTGSTPDGQQISLTKLKGQWLLLSVAGGECNSDCQNNLYLQRQVREGLGKERDRVDWVWIINDEKPINANLLPALKDATVLRVNNKELLNWLYPKAGDQLTDHLYLVDPMGNWMMRFPASMDAAAALKAKKDLERLMRASAGWDLAGR